MKFSSLTLVAAVALLASCNQTPPATEQAGTEPAAAPAATETPTATAPAADTTAAATPAPEAAAAPAAASTENLSLSFRFKQGPASEDRKTAAHLLLKGSKEQDIDLGQFSGKPDVVDKAKAKLAGFPGEMLMGFRSYDPGSGTSYDLAVLNVGGRTLRIVQRKVEEQADKAPEFQTSREIPLPANAALTVAPAVKK